MNTKYIHCEENIKNILKKHNIHFLTKIIILLTESIAFKSMLMSESIFLLKKIYIYINM